MMDVGRSQRKRKQKKWLRNLSRKRSGFDRGFDEKKFVERFAIYKKNFDFSNSEKSTPEIDYYATVFDSDDRNEKSKKGKKVRETFGEDIRRISFESANDFDFFETPEMKKLFRKNKKNEKEERIGDEMWTLAENPRKNFLRISAFAETGDDFAESKDRERFIWKTARISLPVGLDEEIAGCKVKNRKMLWRSIEHVQRLYEENYMRHVARELINGRLIKTPSEINGFDTASDSTSGKKSETEPATRKVRLSRWNFLRCDTKWRRKSDEFPKSNKSKSYSKFFARKIKEKSSGEDGKKRNSLDGSSTFFDDFSSETEESCVCSCCSCDTSSSGTSFASIEPFGSRNLDGFGFYFLSKEKMVPNSEEDFQSKHPWGMEFVEKEPLRPPVYNPEDYATSLKKWGRKTNFGMQLPLYLSQSTGSIEKVSADLYIQEKVQPSPCAKSTSNIKNAEEKCLGKKEKDFTVKSEKRDVKNKENIHRGTKNDLNIDFRNPILALANQQGEMSLKQFSSVTELLGKLKVDLKFSFPSFVQEFVGDPVDGVTLLLELLRAIQLSQASQQQRRPPQIFRRALLDEHSCLVCLKHCLRCSDATRRLVSSPAGLFTLTVCIMSNVTKSRMLALELLTKACEIPVNGHKAVSEALSTLRLRFGEPVRFRFLVGMLNSAGTIELLATAMRFINVFVETAPSIQQKVYIQAELEQAGFDAKTLRKTLPCNSESVKTELSKWEKSYFDVEILQNRVGEVKSLHEKIHFLEKRIEILQEEKGILQSLEQCLKERCSELEEEMSVKTSATAKSHSANHCNNYNVQENKRIAEKGESTPAEDEGISSSEQELSQDEDYVKREPAYSKINDNFGLTKNSKDPRKPLRSVQDVRLDDNNVSRRCDEKNFKNIRRDKMIESNVDDGNEIIVNDNDEEEATIDEVIEELENIVNDAETEAYAKEESTNANKKSKSDISVKINVENSANEKFFAESPEKEIFEETEIIPSVLHPQPPRKAKSLVHIYFPRRDFDGDDSRKNEFFEEYTDSESSDSLLTATREKLPENCRKSLMVTDSMGSFSSANTRSLFVKGYEKDDCEDVRSKIEFGYEERNIDEEEKKRKHLKNDGNIKTNENHAILFDGRNGFVDDKKKRLLQKDLAGERRKAKGSAEVSNEWESGNFREKTNFFRGMKSRGEIGKSPWENSPKGGKHGPAPSVKRSQTFHIITSECDSQNKRNEARPQPKMGVSGLDLQRIADQKAKNDTSKHQGVEYKKNLERKPDAAGRYSKRIVKDRQKNQTEDDENSCGYLRRRESFDGILSLPETNDRSVDPEPENSGSGRGNGESAIEMPCAKTRSKSLEKMDEGLDSLVSIVISTDETKKWKPKTEGNGDGSKNIGPRTRSSLAESSLFVCRKEKMPAMAEESPKPPKPAQRTSLSRNNSSMTAFQLPEEVKLAPVQPNPRQQFVYNFGMKSSKSEDSLFSEAKRFPPDGSSTPSEFENRNPSDGKIPIYSTPVKQSKNSKNFFGNSRFECDTTNRNVFGSDRTGNEKPVFPAPRNVQKAAANDHPPWISKETNRETVRAIESASGNPLPVKNNSSKPNFLFGTYQSPAAKNIPKPSSSVLNSINNFNNSFLVKKSNVPGFGGTVESGRNADGSVGNRKSNAGNASPSEKLTDSPSGLY